MSSIVAPTLEQIQQYTPEQQTKALAVAKKIQESQARDLARGSFLEYAKYMYPPFIAGRHHKIIAEAFDRIISGDLKRLIIALPPRHTKSIFASYLLPSKYLGHFPDHKIIQASHTAELAVGFGRDVRNLVASKEYKEVFPNTQLTPDSKAAGRWSTSKKGSYFAIGVGGAVAGKGSNLLIIDDPSSEQDYMANDSGVFDRVYDWYTAGPRQRLQPDAAIVLVGCIEGSERILMADGTWKPIKDITTDDSVIGYDNGKSVPKKVLAHKSCGEDDLLRVTSRSCSTLVNARHPFLVIKGGLKTGARTREDVIQSRNWSLEWVQASELQPGDTVVTIKKLGAGNWHRPMACSANPDMPKHYQMMQEDYWLFGFLFGDGWIINAGKRGVTGFCFARGVDEELNQRVLGIIERRLGVTGTFKSPEGYYRFDASAVGRWLVEMGLKSGAKIKRVPEWVYKLRVSDKTKFLEGFFDADGFRKENRATSVGLANRELIDDLRLLARTCGYKTTKIYHQRRTCQPPNSPKPIEADSYTARFADKRRKFELKGRYGRQGELGRYFRLEDVEKIESAGRGEVFDITVDGAESFVSEGFVVHNTRWNMRDLAGRIIKNMTQREGVDQWEVIEFPAIMPSGKALWPEYWPLRLLEPLRAELPAAQWAAQYQQNPTAAEGAIIKREWWKIWKQDKAPECEHIIQSWDTAFLKTQRADKSACTTWGVFYLKDDDEQLKANIILLDSYQERLEFPELKKIAYDMYVERKPDAFIIEGKASGWPLIFELRQMGIPVVDYTPARGTKANPNDKISRVNGIATLFESGVVWCPQTRWAEEVMDQMVSFPEGPDDLTDAATIALSRFRQGGFLQLDSDEVDEPSYRRTADYY